MEAIWLVLELESCQIQKKRRANGKGEWFPMNDCTSFLSNICHIPR